MMGLSLGDIPFRLLAHERLVAVRVRALLLVHHNPVQSRPLPQPLALELEADGATFAVDQQLED
jgi:pyruvate carboxylase